MAIAPPSRDACPCTPNGDTVSPASARFLITTPSNGERTLVFSSASSATLTRARAEAIAASAAFTRAADTCAADFGAVSVAVVVMPSLVSARWRSSVAHVLVARRRRLRELRFGFGDGAARRLELRVDVGVLDLGNHLRPCERACLLRTCSRASRPPIFTPTSLLWRATT